MRARNGELLTGLNEGVKWKVKKQEEIRGGELETRYRRGERIVLKKKKMALENLIEGRNKSVIVTIFSGVAIDIINIEILVLQK